MRCLLISLTMAVSAGLPVSRAAEEPLGPRAIVIGSDGSVTNNETAGEPGEEEGFVTPKSIEEVAGSAGPTTGMETNPAALRQPEPANWKPIVEAMQLMIDQQKLSLEAMERARSESIDDSRRNAALMENKLGKLEDALAAQRTHEAETVNRMNRLVVGVAAGFAGTGFVVMVLTAWFFMRTMNRVAEINADIQSQLLALPHSQSKLVGEGTGAPVGNQRLLGALEQLEKRIRDLEHTSGPGATGHEESHPTLESVGSFSEPSLGVDAGTIDLEKEGEPSVSALMAKGQTLLNLDDAEQALECFDAALGKDPRNADALLKKGTALERLRRMQEALDAYDAALQQDDSLTMAYLAKGGICNRLERYAEALECYERALRVQQQGAA